MSTKVLVLGIDASSSALVDRWVADGTMPAVAGVVERGMRGPIHGVEGFYVGSTWPSLYTGRGPAGHGFYRILQLSPGSYDFHQLFDRDGGLQGKPFWREVSDAGRRVAVFDVPLTRLEALNGLHCVEWGGHDILFGFRTSPPDFADRILERYGTTPVPPDMDVARSTVEEIDRWVTGLEEQAATKARMTIDVMKGGAWDLVTQVFTESHQVGHQCWHLHDPSHPSHDPELRAALGDPLGRVYRAIDRAVGEVLAHAEGATVLLFSAHGMSHSRGAEMLLPEILVRLGVCHEPPPALPPPPTMKSRARGLVAGMWHGLPEGVRAAMRPLRDRVGPEPEPWVPRIFGDTKTSRCFPIPNGHPVSGIRLNLAGREPDGVLHPDEVDRFCAALAQDLLDIIDERTGLPVVEAVHRTDDLHAGPRRDVLPDVLVEWKHLPATGTAMHREGRGSEVRIYSEKIGRLVGINDWHRTGQHVRDGWYAAAGPAIAHRPQPRPISILDVHPTVCRLLGVEVPDAEGSPVPEMAGG
jgi:predicted AlkP superfamily phosphohydrolase/phosphomutase